MKVHLVDGTFELFRAHYSPRPGRTTPDGRDIKATHGLAQSLIALLGQPDVTHIAAAFDSVIRSFRNDLFDGYKTGDGVEPDLLAQFPLAEQITAAVGALPSGRWKSLRRTTPSRLPRYALRRSPTWSRS